ncbi:MAG: calycin-like domain-containing protein [Dysgonamonadaceae bacterium]|jgi:hypothetical protein|nr:calycin-like domain-containing protein [Dysgonamonadaceae bacterium]
MNTKIKLFFILFTFMCIGIVSCNDDEKKTETDYAKEIAGKYIGAITSGDVPIAPNAEVNVEYVSENKVTLKMNQEVLGLPINIACESDVKYSNNEYNVSGDVTLNLIVSAEAPAMPVPVSLSGKIDSKKVATLNINVAAPADPSPIQGLPISVVFTGTKQ